MALVFVEDDIGVGSCIRHHARLGFRNILLLGAGNVDLPDDCEDLCHKIDSDLSVPAAINKAIEAYPGRWLFYCYNAEYLHFPFCEDRSVEEFTTFINEERRHTSFTYVVDIYSDDLDISPFGYSLENAHLDKSGYYALTRYRDGEIMERQLDVFGGLKWRYEEHFPYEKRRIDRIGLFQARKGLEMDGDNLFNDQEYNTFECPWHNSASSAVCSFRTAKYLKSNPGSTYEITTFKWDKSEKFHWNSRQLMDLGLMEPGQWF